MREKGYATRQANLTGGPLGGYVVSGVDASRRANRRFFVFYLRLLNRARSFMCRADARDVKRERFYRDPSRFFLSLFPSALIYIANCTCFCVQPAATRAFLSVSLVRQIAETNAHAYRSVNVRFICANKLIRAPPASRSLMVKLFTRSPITRHVQRIANETERNASRGGERGREERERGDAQKRL